MHGIYSLKKAMMRYNKDNYKVALRFYEKAVEKDCEDGLVWYRYAYSCEQINGYDDSDMKYWKAYRFLKDQYPDHKYVEFSLKKLFKEGGNPKGYLLDALILRHIEYAKKYLKEIDDVNYSNRSGQTPLFIASAIGYIDIVKLLLKKGATLNDKTRQDNDEGDWEETALSVAINYEHLEIAKLLLDHGADFETTIQMRDKYLTPVLLAIEKGQNEILGIMLDLGADTDKGVDETTPLLVAIVNSNNEAVGMLLEYGADINTVVRWRDHDNDSMKSSSLVCAIVNSNNEAVGMLLESGADAIAQIGVWNRNGSLIKRTTPLACAIANDNNDVA